MMRSMAFFGVLGEAPSTAIVSRANVIEVMRDRITRICKLRIYLYVDKNF